MIVCPQQSVRKWSLELPLTAAELCFWNSERQPSQVRLWSCMNVTNTGVQKGCVLQASDLLLSVTGLNLEHVFLNSAPGMRQVSLWSQPRVFAVKDVGGVSRCEVLSEGSQAPRMLCLDYFFPWLFEVCFEPRVRAVSWLWSTTLLHWHPLKSKLWLKFSQHLL